MARYIDAELIDLDRVSDSICQWQAQEAIEDTPTADVRENVHAHWIKHENRECWFCSHCNTDDYYAYSWDCNIAERELQDLFCPNCGAQMDERREDE